VTWRSSKSGGRPFGRDEHHHARCGAITNISFDHQAILGDHAAAHRRRKGGPINKTGVPVVIAPQFPEAAQTLEACAQAAARRVKFSARHSCAVYGATGCGQYAASAKCGDRWHGQLPMNNGWKPVPALLSRQQPRLSQCTMHLAAAMRARRVQRRHALRS